MRALTAPALFAATMLASCGEPVTKGDIWDMEAADESVRCARQYLGRPNSGPEVEIWIMCTQINAQQGRRDVIRVANSVIRKQGKNVFEPGATRELSAAMSSRLQSGE